jgi:hypothetical protein
VQRNVLGFNDCDGENKLHTIDREDCINPVLKIPYSMSAQSNFFDKNRVESKYMSVIMTIFNMKIYSKGILS